MHPLKIAALVVTIVLLVAGGTVFFRLVEGWSWLDSYFFTVITLSTVGYGSIVPATALGKIGTTVFILLGIGVFVVGLQQFGVLVLRKREEHTEKLISLLPGEDPGKQHKQRSRRKSD
ncbi:potassium channel family protein [Marinovum sp.]|uniref:potassium channel family protein n=1 Tax=Marinovum sp. TaxID=2024839 RepID=UPI003A8D8D02